MKKFTFSLLIATLLNVANVFAQGGTTGPLTWNLNGSTLTISGNGAMPDYQPEESPWYEYQESIHTVVVEIGVTSIGNSAFYYCTSLSSITVPNSVKSIGYGAFWSCTSLTSVTIPDGVTSIGYGAFWYCTSLTSITIPNSVTTIGEWAFWFCTDLTSITIPNGVTNIGDWTFAYCESLTSITIPNGVINVGSWVFRGCTSLTSIAIPNGVTSIGMGTFYDCTSLSSITIPNGITTIEFGTFEGCTSLTSITIPDGVTSIGEWAFYECTTLSSVIIPNSVTTIGNNAFRSCTSLPLIIIPDDVTNIGMWAFAFCESLTSITIPNSVKSIEDFTFCYCTGLTSITITNSIKSIGKGTFYYCKSLTSITIPDGVTSIASSTFFYCKSLISITIPNAVKTIEDYAFSNCTNLTSVTIPSNLTKIGEQAFFCCETLVSMTNLKLAPITINSSVFGGMNQSACTLKVPTSAVSAYYNAAEWSKFKIIGGGILVNPFSDNSERGYTTGNGLYEKNKIATVTAIADNSYKFVNWKKDGIVIFSDSLYSFTVTENVELVAHFIKEDSATYWITASVNNEEYGTVIGSGKYGKNETAKIIALANTGYKFVNWKKDGIVVSSDSSYSFAVTEDAELVANFVDKDAEIYSITVSANNEKYGTGIGSGKYVENETATIIAIANSGYVFVNWTKNGEEVSTDSLYSFTVTENVKLVANFETGQTGIVETPLTASVQVYPNPTSGILNLIQDQITSHELQVKNIEVFDVMGKKQRVESGKQNVMDISDLPAGVYFLQIQTENGMVTRKVIKR